MVEIMAKIYLITCTGVDYYTHFSETDKSQDFEVSTEINYDNVNDLIQQVIYVLSYSGAPDFIEYLDFSDLLELKES